MRGLIRLIIILLAVFRSLFFWNIKKRDPKKILIAHDLLLGDTLLLAPLMKRIHEKYPNAQKYVLAKFTLVPLFGNAPYGFTALSYNPRSFLSLWKIFCEGPYDLAFIAGDNRYSWLARAVGSRWIQGIEGDTPPWKNWMLDEAKSFDVKPATWADMMGRLIDGKNPKPYQKNEWPCPDIKKLFLPFDRSKPYVVCHLGASNSLKFWQASSWRVLINNLRKQKYEVVLSVGPNEEYLINEIDPDCQYHHVPGTFSLIEMWALVEQAKLIVSVDTGIAHLAKLTGTAIVTLFGPGSPISHGEGLFWKKSIHYHATKDNFICRDQPILFRRKVNWLNRCGRGVSECKTPGACMEVITPKQVLNVLYKNDLFS
jgi:ADP-heptose:LPS heptosyltransferase